MEVTEENGELVLEIQQPNRKRSRTPSKKELEYDSIPENLPTLQELYDSNNNAWLTAQRLISPETLLRLQDPAAIMAQIENEAQRLEAFIKNDDEKNYDPVAVQLAKKLLQRDNHLSYFWKAFTTQQEVDAERKKLKARTNFNVLQHTDQLRKKEAALEKQKDQGTVEKQNQIKGQLKYVKEELAKYHELEKLTYALNGHKKSIETYAKPSGKWPGEPDNIALFFRDLPNEMDDVVEIEQPFKPPDDPDELLRNINQMADGKNGPTPKKKLALRIYDQITPYLKGIKQPIDLSLKDDSQLSLVRNDALLLKPLTHNGKYLVSEQGKVLLDQIRPRSAGYEVTSYFLNNVLNQLTALGLGTEKITKDELQEIHDGLNEMLKPPKPVNFDRYPEDVSGSEASEFVPSETGDHIGDNLKSDADKQKEYFTLLNSLPKIEEDLNIIQAELEKTDYSRDEVQSWPADKQNEWLTNRFALASKERELLNRRAEIEQQIKHIKDNYLILDTEEFSVAIKEQISSIIDQLKEAGQLDLWDKTLTELRLKPSNDDAPKTATPPIVQDSSRGAVASRVPIAAALDQLAPSVIASPEPFMIVTDAPSQLASLQPAPPKLSDEDKQLIKIGKDLIGLLRTRKTFNIESSADLLPTVNNLLRSLDEINGNYQQLLQESSKETERIVGMTNEHEALKQLLENTKVELNNTRVQLDEKNRELDSMRTASEAPSTTVTQGAGIQTTEPVRTKVITDEQRELRQQLNTSNLNLFRARSQLAKNDRIASKLNQQNAQNTENSIKILQNELDKTRTVNTQLRDELATMRINLAQQITKIEPPPPMDIVAVPAPQGVVTKTFTTQTDPPRSLHYTTEDFDAVLLERDELQRRLEHLTRQYNELMTFTDNQDFQTDERVVESQMEAQAYFDLLQEEQKKNDELRRQLSHAEGERRKLEGALSDEAMRDQIALIQSLQEQLNESEAQKVDLNKKIDALKKKTGHQNIKNFHLKNKINNLRDENEALRNDLDHSYQEYYDAARYEEQTQDQLWRILGNSESSKSRNALSDIQALIQSLKYQKYQLERQLAEQTNEGQALRAAHEQAIKELTDKHEADLQEAKNQYDAKNRNTLAHYEQRLDNHIAQYDVRYGKFQRESEANLKETVNDYVVQIDGLKAAHEVQLARLDADYQAQITALQEELAARDSSLAALTNPNIDQYYRPFFESARVVLNHYTDLIRDEAIKDLPVVRDIFNIFMDDLKERLNLQREMEWQTFKTHTKTAIMTTEHQHATNKQVLNQQAQENARYQNHQHDESMAKLRSDLEQKKKKRARRAEKQDAQLRAINAANIRMAHNQLASALIGRLIGSNDSAAVTHGYSMLAEFTKSLLTLPEDELNHPSIQEYIKMYNNGTLDRLVNVLAQPKQPVDDALSKRITDLEGTVRSFINITAQRTAHVGAAQAYHPPRRVFVGREGVPHQGNRYARGYRSSRRLPPRRPDGRFKRVSPARKHKK